MTSMMPIQTISKLRPVTPRQQYNTAHTAQSAQTAQTAQSEDYGQYIDIHPNMYEYKQQVSTYASKFVVRQFISTDCFDEYGNIQHIKNVTPYSSDQSLTTLTTLTSNDKNLYSKLYYTNFPRYILLCIIYAMNYINKWFSR